MTIRLTRRHLLASAAAGGAALSVDPSSIASAQGAQRIEQFAPELDGIISIGEAASTVAIQASPAPNEINRRLPS